MADIREYIDALKDSRQLGHLVVHHEKLSGREAEVAQCRRPLPVTVERLLSWRGIDGLYSHQARAMDILRSGRSVVVATPTASGKTLIYNLPVIEQILMNPDSRALYLFPLKALAQDQLRGFNELVAPWPDANRPEARIYDGDTSQWFRKKIRENPPHVLMTNPEMLHLSMLPYHEQWSAFWAGLTHVVVDEVHTYRGVLGSHMAQVFRRLRRVCARYGASPNFAFLSATVGNPAQLAHDLTGVDAQAITESGAPQGTRHFLFINPALTMAESPSQVAIQLLKAALARGLRTIVYCQSRKMTELISMWAAERSGPYRERISAYRAGFLPEERRDIEARMASGELLAVVSTSALELGIDIGSLDLCILVGYPGTVMSTLQRGGRVGRARQESAVALVAGEDQLDQYFMKNPQDFFVRPPECAVLNPVNPVIVEKHLVCAAAELTLSADEPWLREPGMPEQVARLEREGRLLRSADGRDIHSSRKRPHREVSLRGSSRTFSIVTGSDRLDDENGEGETSVGDVDEHRAYTETYPGAVYLHRGRTYVVEDLDIAAGVVRARPARVDYYTRVRSEKSTQILEITGVRAAYGCRVFRGRLKVTQRIQGYEKRRIRGGKLMTVVPLDLPELTFETDGLWIEVPREIQRRAEDEFLHFMGGIHAVEHAAIGILPLLVMTDRNDLGGISIPYHEQVGCAAVFIYDGMPGGVGLTSQAFETAEELIDRTLTVIETCECELGCPSCVHSPKCGSGNRPIDKGAALYLLRAIKAAPRPKDLTPPELPVARENSTGNSPDTIRNTNRIEVAGEGAAVGVERSSAAGRGIADVERFAVLDLETQLSAQEVGGWGNARRMRVSCVCVYDSATDATRAYLEADIPALIDDLRAVPLVVGFNIRRFDYEVLSGYSDFDFRSLPTVDMLEHVHRRLGYRLSLDHLARATLGAQKSADGLKALEWWKQGRIDDIIAYCTQDVAVTRDLYAFGRDNGYLLFTNKAGNAVRLPVDWNELPG
ncbi:DEAD/DEAH box helicase domain-containing protein [Desulfobaculum xiamenense]|uniref:DEAD/DEAH box helicase domain-containing protein n=1 Tax=Desulfobaculum xiamenense TaxID=995050 RepID=A0A846QTJ9_9BACT|nr:DEAD/DEAH box helicase [Desulfobaculum xiamenense]NJB67959.1 DEAD/DEAH box helicase domain-containing protein [Desulfobaculum xiamenense]